MALTGHLSDLSLSELIEFFCNQRKSGRLRVLYPQGSGYFYLSGGFRYPCADWCAARN